MVLCLNFIKDIDDIIGATFILTLEPDQFIDYLCNFHSAFQFTFDVSEKEIEFLDIKKSVSRKTLSTLVHYYFRYGSCHPKASLLKWYTTL